MADEPDRKQDDEQWRKEITRLEEAIAGLSKKLDSLPAGVDPEPIEKSLTTLQQQVEKLNARADALEKTPPPTPPPPPPKKTSDDDTTKVRDQPAPVPSDKVPASSLRRAHSSRWF